MPLTMPAFLGLFTYMRKTTSFVVAACAHAASLVGGLLLLAACSSSVPEPEEPSAEEPSAEMAELQARVARAKAKRDKKAKQAARGRAPIPAECANTEDEGCLPPQQWVNKLCNGVYPEVALHMFRG